MRHLNNVSTVTCPSTCSEDSFEKSREFSTADTKYKTELCRTWVETNACPYNEKCRFAHGKKELHDKIIIGKNYKSKECKTFHTRGFCPYGPRCHFRHDQRRLEQINRSYYSIKLVSDEFVEECLKTCEEPYSNQSCLLNKPCLKDDLSRLPVLKDLGSFQKIQSSGRFCKFNLNYNPLIIRKQPNSLYNMFF
jgi:hypothetical protein